MTRNAREFPRADPRTHDVRHTRPPKIGEKTLRNRVTFVTRPRPIVADDTGVVILLTAAFAVVTSREECRVGWFAGRSRRTQGRRKAGVELTDEQRAALPPRFVAAGEALAARNGFVIEACWVVGRDLAEVGASLGESLDGLRATTQLVARRDPTFEESHAVSLAWSEATLGYLHGLSCADPLTGLSTMAHIRHRLADLYRDARADGHALVVTEASLPRLQVDPVDTARRMTLLGQTARTVFSGTETIGQVGYSKLVVVARRDDSLAPRVSLLKRMVEDNADRVWIEGLPTSDQSAVHLLDELARAT